jgi:hypothetical protein
VFAGGAHETMLWTTESGATARFTGKDSIADYSKVKGYNEHAPLDNGQNPTDKGTDVRAGLSYRQKTGLVDATGKRHKIGAFVRLEIANTTELLEALYLFSAVGVGFKFPDSAMDQFDKNKPWSVVPGPAPTEGHYVPLVAYRKNLVCVSWGRVQEMTVSFFEKYTDEAWAILSPEFLAQARSPEGFDLAQLKADLAAVQAN